MSLLVDTSVWSLALRRDAPPDVPEIEALRRDLAGSDVVVTTGLILQELLQGFVPEKARGSIFERFGPMPLLAPDRDDHVAAAHLRATCRSDGVQLGTVDALIAQLAIRHGHTLLTTDRDVVHASAHVPIPLWRG